MGSSLFLTSSRRFIVLIVEISAGNCECRNNHPKCYRNIPKEKLLQFFADHLPYFNTTTRHRHLFTATNVIRDMHPLFRNFSQFELVTTIGPSRGCPRKKTFPTQNCGQMVVPYVNTNRENQPDMLLLSTLGKQQQEHRKGVDERTYAVGA